MAARTKLPKYDIFVPTVYLGNHHFVVEYFTRNNKDVPHFPRTLARCVELFTNMLYEIGNSTAKNIVISAESFSIIDLPDLMQIRDHFPKYRISILLYYRNTLSWSYSMYRQELRDFPLRTPVTLSAYLLQAVPLDSPIASYMSIFYKFEKAFGRDNMKIVDYDGFQRHGVNIMDSFFSALNLRVDGSVFESMHKVDQTGKTSNTGLDSVEIHTRQLWRMFDMYCQDHKGCSTYNARNDEILRYSHLSNRTTLGTFAPSIPVKCLHLGMLSSYSLELDKLFRQNFGDVILYGDAKATAELITAQSSLCQLDIDAVLTGERERWNKIFRRQFAQLSSEGLVCT